jgi:hypothetical protein
MKMRGEDNGRILKVQWTTERWNPTITHLAASNCFQMLGDDLPMMRKTIRRKRQVLWTGASVRFNRNNLPGLNGSRTSWR